MSRPSGLKDWQLTMDEGVLYSAFAKEYTSRAVKDGSAAQIRPTIEILGDATADVLGSQIYSADPESEMPVIMANVNGIAAFDFVPNFLYVTGSPDSIVVSGVAVRANRLMAAAIYSETYIYAPLEELAVLSAEVYSETFVSASISEGLAAAIYSETFIDAPLTIDA